MTKTILILSANPRKDLDLKYEIHTLKGVIERSQEGEQFEIKIGSAVRPQDLQDLFHRYEPWLVHFCGHGTGEQGLVLEDDKGKERLVSTSAISNLFKNFSDKIECALLNACYSERQADAIVQHINYAIGIRQEIRDDTAIVFARGFYQALGYGKSISEAFNLGCNAIEINSYNSDLNIPQSKILKQDRKLIPVSESPEIIPPEHMKPQLKIKSSLTFYSSEDLPVNSELYPTLIKTTQEEIARKRYREDCQDDFGLGQFSLQRRQPLNQQEYRWKKVLLNKVKDSWIKGVLENSLHSKILFELDIRERRDAIERPFSNLEEFSQDSDKSFEWLQASDFFEEMGMGKTLLILGEPGTGKTISLLKLAERLIKRTEQDLSLSIPVVFNLSSWGIKRQAIADWLVTELRDKYQVSSSLGKQWIQEEELILLLDGLDEVQAEYRNDCVRALNEFIETYGVTEIVICSRVRDYEALSERLKLRSAICIQKLSSEYIDWYLEDIGESLIGLSQLLKEDKELEDFAKTPLILSIMTTTYQGYSLEDLLQEVSIREKRYEHLFSSYVDRILSRRINTQKFSRYKTQKWLIWLAKMMKNNSQTIFKVDDIQPYRISEVKSKISYSIILNLVLILFLTCIFRMNAYILSDNTYMLAKLALAKSLIIFFLVLLSIVNSVPVLWGPSYSAFNKYGIIYPWKSINFSFSRFSNELYRRFMLDKIGKKMRILCYLIVPLIVLLLMILKAKDLISLQDVIAIIAAIIFPFYFKIFDLFCAIAVGMIDNQVNLNDFPNQEIFNSAKNGIILGVPLLTISSLSLKSLSFLLTHLSSTFQEISGVDEDNIVILYSFVLLFTILGLWRLFLPSIQHLCLRTVLYINRSTPWNYARFLDYAVERIFMYRLGGSYIFIHRMLMEHFAQMKEEEMRS